MGDENRSYWPYLGGSNSVCWTSWTYCSNTNKQECHVEVASLLVCVNKRTHYSSWTALRWFLMTAGWCDNASSVSKTENALRNFIVSKTRVFTMSASRYKIYKNGFLRAIIQVTALIYFYWLSQKKWERIDVDYTSTSFLIEVITYYVIIQFFQ